MKQLPMSREEHIKQVARDEAREAVSDWWKATKHMTVKTGHWFAVETGLVGLAHSLDEKVQSV